MATRLKNMRLTSVDLVRQGANQEADICLFKGMDVLKEDPHPKKAPASPRTISKSDPDRYVRIEEFP